MAVDQGGPGAGAPGAGRSAADRPAADPAQPTGPPAGPAEPPGEAADPASIATQPDFGRELTQARQRAGLTVREVARAAGIPASTAGDYFAGRHLPPPSQPGLLPRILAACGETDPARLREWAAALARVRRVPGRRPAATAPYRGLASFQPEDAAWFFGREDLTGRLAGLAAGQPAGLPLTVVGPSGSGKSSLLRAGLIPALSSSAGSRLVLFTPGAAPLAELARQLTGLAPPGPGAPPGPDAAEARLRGDPAAAAALIDPAGRPAIIVDQFEVVFTASLDEPAQRAFISAVCALAGPAVVVLALRADFYARALHHPELARALQERQVVVGPMTRDEVRRAIVEPARLARLDVTDGLVEVLLRDLEPRSADGTGHEAGALPLLSHALLTTWEHSRGGQLTVADYQASGGIQHAIARTADRVYGELDEAGRQTARRLFLRLVHVADDAPDTRRAAPLGELRDCPASAGSPDGVLARFVAQRLITVDADRAQITHEALLTAWPLLHSWLDADREGLRIQRRISDAARAWHEAGRDRAALLRGGQLALARDWAADPVNAASLDTLTGDFVTAGTAEERLQEAAERRRARRLRRLVAALTAAAVVTIGLAGYAFQQREAATSARDRATSAMNIAQSREVAIEADEIRGQNTSLAAQLSIAAYRIATTPQARASLLESSGTPAASRLIDTAGVIQAIGLSPDHRVLAVAGADGSLRLWDVARPGQPVPLGRPLAGRHHAPLYAVAFSPGGQTLAAAGAQGQVWLWDVSDPERAVRYATPLTGPASTVYSLAFSPDGRVLAAGSADRTVRLWDVADPGHPAGLGRPLSGAGGYVQAVAFSPDGKTLAAGSADRTVRLWNVARPARATPLGPPLAGPGALVTSVAFSPDGRTLAAGSQDHKVWLWHLGRPGRAGHPAPAGTLAGATNWVNTVSFGPGGRTLAAGSSDDRVLVWNLATRALTAALPSPQPVTSLAWAGGHLLFSGDADGRVRAWQLPAPVLRAGGAVNAVAYSAGGRYLAVGGTDLQLWDPARRLKLAARAIPGPADNVVNAVAFAPRAPLLATGYGNGTLQLWRVSGAGALTAAGRPVRSSTLGLVESAAFSPDGRVLATGEDDGTIRLWSVTGPGGPRLLGTVHDSHTYVFSVAFRPDGRTLAAASADNLTRLWNVSDPRHPAQLCRLGGPASYAISVAFSPDGAVLAVGAADKTTRLWDVADPARPVPLGPPLTGPEGYVYSVAFSPDGRMLATGVTDGTVWLWHVGGPGRPKLLATLTGPARQVYSVAFGPRGAELAAGSADGTVRLWDTSAPAAARAVCATAGQPLTRAEWAAYLPGRRYAPPCRPARGGRLPG